MSQKPRWNIGCPVTLEKKSPPLNLVLSDTPLNPVSMKSFIHTYCSMHSPMTANIHTSISNLRTCNFFPLLFAYICLPGCCFPVMHPEWENAPYGPMFLGKRRPHYELRKMFPKAIVLSCFRFMFGVPQWKIRAFGNRSLETYKILCRNALVVSLTVLFLYTKHALK